MATSFYDDMMERKRRMLPMSLGAGSPDGVLTQNVQTGAALPRSLQIRKQIADLESQDDDMSAMQAYGRQQGESGQTAMLNALAAQFAGDRFEPVQAQFLKRAAAAQQPMKVGRGMVTPDGQYIVDPGARREAQLGRLSREADLADRLEAQAASQAERLQAQRDAQAERLQAQAAQAQRDAELKRELRASGGGAQPYFQPVQTAQGVYAFNSRLGRMELVAGPDGKPIIGAAADPTLQGAIAGAKTTGSELAKQGTEAIAASKTGDKLLTALTQAEGILKSGPTGSGAGAVLDAAGRAVGVSRDAAVKAGQLETLSGWLVANVPRMEGPQSNFDVQVYTTMAGKVGNRTVPVPERLAALDELRKLQTKYKSLNQNAPAAPGAEQPKRRIRFDAQGNAIP
jgi:hypothetical protein